MATTKRQEDRRIQRTRQVLQQAFVEAIQEKGHAHKNLREVEKSFMATSVQEIAARANVNRGTFYLHFPDKYILVDTVARERFRQQLADVLPPECHWDRKTVHMLTATVMNLLEKKYGHQHQPSRILAPMVEKAIHEELAELLLTWLKAAQGEEKRRRGSLETIARVVSWTIFGSALEWSQQETTVSSEQMAESITQVILEGVARLAPETLPDA